MYDMVIPESGTLITFNDIRIKSTSCHFRVHDIALLSKLKHYIMYSKRC